MMKSLNAIRRKRKQLQRKGLTEAEPIPEETLATTTFPNDEGGEHMHIKNNISNIEHRADHEHDVSEKPFGNLKS